MKNKLASSLGFGASAAFGAAVYDALKRGVNEIDIVWVMIVGASVAIIWLLVPTGAIRKKDR